MPTVIATPGASDANSYVTVAEADAYFADSYGRGKWATSAQADREALVISASRSLDQYINWSGQRATSTQSMEWPRKGTFDRAGNLIPDTIIPSQVKYATYELAYYMLDTGGALSFSDQTVDMVKLGSIEVEFTPHSTDVGIPSFIEEMLANLGTGVVAGANTVGMSRLVRT